jgi:hypothetical protein
LNSCSSAVANRYDKTSPCCELTGFYLAATTATTAGVVIRTTTAAAAADNQYVKKWN